MKRYAFSALLLMLASCTPSPPEGQVVARVDGLEITDRELRAEAAASAVDLNRASARAAVLDRLIDRKLLAAASRAALADHAPAAQLEGRRAQDEVLARAYARRVTADITPPTADEIERFMRANSHRFAARHDYLFDRLTIHGAVPQGVADLSAATVARVLDRSGRPYRRQLILIDSAMLSRTQAARASALLPGQTRHDSTGGRSTLDTLIMKQPVVELADAQRAQAGAMLTEARAAAALKAAIATLRSGADIVVRADPHERVR